MGFFVFIYILLSAAFGKSFLDLGEPASDFNDKAWNTFIGVFFGWIMLPIIIGCYIAHKVNDYFDDM